MTSEKPKILILSRHGKAPQRPEGGSEDTIEDGAIEEIYKNLGGYAKQIVQEYHLGKEDVFLRNTSAIRTRITGLAGLVRAFDLQPNKGSNPPQSVAALDNYDFSGIEMSEDDRFAITRGKPHCNIVIYKAQGVAPLIDYWLANPDATVHEGEKIRPYTSILSAIVPGTQDIVQKLVEGPKDFGLEIIHNSIIEPQLITLVNSGIDTPIEKIAEIGGPIGMGEFAEFKVEKQNGVYQATLKIKDEIYKVDIQNIK